MGICGKCKKMRNGLTSFGDWMCCDACSLELGVVPESVRRERERKGAEASAQRREREDKKAKVRRQQEKREKRSLQSQIAALTAQLAAAEAKVAERDGLTDGRKIVDALFAKHDVNATVREALGRLVDVWLTPSGCFQVCTWGMSGYGWQFNATGKDVGFRYRRTDGHNDEWEAFIPLTDPAAVVAAIQAVIERVSNDR